MSPAASPLLTLEPLIEAVREGVEARGWALSGLQKTTSHQFEGRWAGDSTRSAYLFFHRPGVGDDVSVDVFLDETSQGLFGNLALVVDARPLGEVGEVGAALGALGRLAGATLPEGFRTPVTLRFRSEDGDRPPEEAATEIRFKLRIPRAALEAGTPAVVSLCRATVEAFETLLADPVLASFRSPAGDAAPG